MLIKTIKETVFLWSLAAAKTLCNTNAARVRLYCLAWCFTILVCKTSKTFLYKNDNFLPCFKKISRKMHPHIFNCTSQKFMQTNKLQPPISTGLERGKRTTGLLIHSPHTNCASIVGTESTVTNGRLNC
jgi:hypothetical protein